MKEKGKKDRFFNICYGRNFQGASAEEAKKASVKKKKIKFAQIEIHRG